MKKDLKAIIIATSISLLSAGVAAGTFAKLRTENYNPPVAREDVKRMDDAHGSNIYVNVFGGSVIATIFSAYMAYQLSKMRLNK